MVVCRWWLDRYHYGPLEWLWRSLTLLHPQFMIQGEVTLRIPNPHQGDVGRDLLARILRQAGIDRETWEKA